MPLATLLRADSYQTDARLEHRSGPAVHSPSHTAGSGDDWHGEEGVGSDERVEREGPGD